MQIKSQKISRNAGFTLVEMLVCFVIMSLVIGGILTAYTNTARWSERAGYTLAAQAQAIQVLEHVRAAVWDTQSFPVVDQTTNLPSCTTNILELPIAGTNVIYATNYLSVTTITNSASLGVYFKMIQVDTTWPWNGTTQSNTVLAYRAPDQ